MFPGEVTAAQFDEQMRTLRRHCSPLALSDAVCALREQRLPARAVAVTFDDGYADNAAIALPILQRHSVPATFFVATDYLDGGLMWNDVVIESIRRARGDALDLSAVELAPQPLGPALSRGAVAERVIRAIKHLPFAQRIARVQALARHIDAKLPSDLMMTSDQVRQLANGGMDVGAHTMTHPILRTLDDTQARKEIMGSRERLENLLQKPVRAFAYPNGKPGDDYGLRDRDMVAALGFEFAVSTQPGAAWRDSDVFQLPRFTPWDQQTARWLARLFATYRHAA
jgi:peptidoglycan/xylan/chitin deacetylase (PgdA/CDA1 family)